MKISLVVPLFNEEHSLPIFYNTVKQVLNSRQYTLEIIFINDGSTDNTPTLAQRIAFQDESVIVVNFSRNFGKEAALFAGLEFASGDAIIPVDVDLQDPITVIPLLIQQWLQGADVVLARRKSRTADSYLKRTSAALFYMILNKISSTKIEKDVGDFRLLDRKVVDVIKALPEHQLFMKGVLSWAGFKTSIVEYDRAARSAGSGKFNGWKLWNLALEGITSFSTVPLRVWSYVGSAVALASLIYAGYLVFEKSFLGTEVPSESSLVIAILFIGGVQLIGIGVLGEYIGGIYIESKQRPRYVIRDVVNGRTDS